MDEFNKQINKVSIFTYRKRLNAIFMNGQDTSLEANPCNEYVPTTQRPLFLTSLINKSIDAQTDQQTKIQMNWTIE